MKKFQVLPAAGQLISVLGLVILINRTTPGVIANLFFSVFLFATLTFFISFIFYFARVRLAKRAKFDQDLDWRQVYRNSFKLASIISAFITILAFFKILEVLNIFNLLLSVAIFILFSIYLTMTKRT